MAEGFGLSLSDGDFEVRSAGIDASGVNPDAISAMADIEIDISGQSSDRLTPAHYQWADYVVTVCDAASQRCPAPPSGTKTVHWSIPDPFGSAITEEDKRRNFARVRDMLGDRITSLFDSIRQNKM